MEGTSQWSITKRISLNRLRPPFTIGLREGGDRTSRQNIGTNRSGLTSVAKSCSPFSGLLQRRPLEILLDV
jgi:hypothetical protein